MSNSSLEAKLSVQGLIGAVIKEGCLYSCVTAPISLTIPKGITVLGRSCLSGQDLLERITISSSVIKVEESCLSNCPNLKVIRIHKGQEDLISGLTYGNKAVVRYVTGNE